MGAWEEHGASEEVLDGLISEMEREAYRKTEDRLIAAALDADARGAVNPMGRTIARVVKERDAALEHIRQALEILNEEPCESECTHYDCRAVRVLRAAQAE